jgi:hypothetical protein
MSPGLVHSGINAAPSAIPPTGKISSSNVALTYAARFTDALLSAEIGTVEEVKRPAATIESKCFFIITSHLKVFHTPYFIKIIQFVNF